MRPVETNGVQWRYLPARHDGIQVPTGFRQGLSRDMMSGTNGDHAAIDN
jgi:hypothetical protein